MDNLKAIAEKLDLQVEDLLHHWEHHMPKYLTFRGRVIKGTAAGHPFTEWVREGDSDWLIPLQKVIGAAQENGYVVCKTPKETEEGRRLSKSVLDYYEGIGEPGRWAELVEMVENLWPSFRAVQPVVGKGKGVRKCAKNRSGRRASQ